MNKSQRNAINRIIRRYRSDNAYSGRTSVRVTLSPTNYGPIWVRVETRRSDCDKYSQRAVLCHQRAFIKVGKRGAITVFSATDGFRDNAAHVARMLRGKVKKEVQS